MLPSKWRGFDCDNSDPAALPLGKTVDLIVASEVEWIVYWLGTHTEDSDNVAHRLAVSVVVVDLLDGDYGVSLMLAEMNAGPEVVPAVRNDVDCILLIHPSHLCQVAVDELNRRFGHGFRHSSSWRGCRLPVGDR